MGDGCRSDACLVRECRTFEALDQRAHHAAGNAQPGEGTGEDLAESPADLVGVHQDDDQCRGHIHDAHERNDLLRHPGNRFQPADDDGKNHGRKQHAGNPARILADNAGNLLVCLIGLEHVSAAECAEDTEDREQDRKRLAARQSALCKALGQIVHRTAGNRAVIVFVAVFDAERTLGELRCHAHQAGKDHPEGRARSANADGNRNTGDVAEADGARKGGGKRLEVAYLAGIIRVGIVAAHQFDRMPEGTELDEREIEREDRGSHHEPCHDPGKACARKRTEDEIDEPAGRAGKQLVDGLVDGLCRSRYRRCGKPARGGCHGGKQGFHDNAFRRITGRWCRAR